MYVTALDKLKQLMAAEDWHNALKLAAGWPELGEHKLAIQQAWAAKSNPGFYKQMRKDPAAMVAAGVAALKERYNEHK